PGEAEKQLLLGGIGEEFAGRPLPQTPPALRPYVAGVEFQHSTSAAQLRLGLRLGSPEAHARALELVRDPRLSEADRVSLLEAVGQLGRPESLPVLLDLFQLPDTNRIQLAALASLQRFPDEQVGRTLLAFYFKLLLDVQVRARDVLCSRK